MIVHKKLQNGDEIIDIFKFMWYDISDLMCKIL